MALIQIDDKDMDAKQLSWVVTLEYKCSNMPAQYLLVSVADFAIGPDC